MSERLQVLLEAGEFRRLRQVARQARVSVGEWVRTALRKEMASLPERSVEEKLAAVRKMASHSCATGDIEEILVQIAKGYAEQP